MEIKLIDIKNKKIEVPDVIFSCDFNQPLVHQVVSAFLAAGRAGTRAQKNRASVSGGGTKPWKQKGSGRARAGTIRSPLWRKGGVTFAAKPQSYKQKVNRKMYRGAMCSILSELIRLDRLSVVDKFEVETHKTKDLLKKLEGLGAVNKVLIVTDSVEKNLYLSARNIPTVNVCDVTAADPVSLVESQHVVMTSAALKQFEELLK